MAGARPERLGLIWWGQKAGPKMQQARHPWFSTNDSRPDGACFNARLDGLSEDLLQLNCCDILVLTFNGNDDVPATTNT